MKAQAVDESLNDIDRGHLSYMTSVITEEKMSTTADIAEVIVTRCFDVDEPVFRHLLAGDMQGDIEQAVNDLSGEAAVAWGRKMIGAS